MDYYPLFLDLKNKHVLVIGGGAIALEKIQNLLKAGAKITVIAPSISPPILRFNRRITFIHRAFQPNDIQTHYTLIFSATGDSKLNKTVSTLCKENRILCNAVDDPNFCHFIVPSIFRRGRITVAISTGGVSPTLAKDIKFKLKTWIDQDYTRLTRWLVGLRPKLKKSVSTLEKRKEFWTHFYAQNPIKILKQKGVRGLDHLISALLKTKGSSR